MIISGIYAIRNNANKCLYIGSSQNVIKRKYDHFSQLRNGRHDNQHLQRAFAKYGEGSFSHHILLRCAADNLLVYEQHFLDALRPAYNIAKFASACMRGRKHTAESRAKMSRSRKGKKFSLEHRQRISLAHQGKIQAPHTEEHKRKISEANKGKKHTDETKRKISEANKGRKHSEETRRKNGEAKNKAVMRISPQTGEEKLYKSMTEAKLDGGFDQTNISRCCKGTRKMHKGYAWKYAE